MLRACAGLGLDCDPPLAEKLAIYLGTLQKWNTRMNLVGPAQWPQVLAELVVDSWHLRPLLATLPLPARPLCLDLGAGAGLPGIPLRLLWQEGRYLLVELRGKRAMFLQQVLALLPLPGTEVFEGRAEEALSRHAPVDLVLSRAFMPWPALLELIAPHLAPAGCTVIMANTPAPDPLPPTWRLLSSAAYTAGGKERHLWALTPAGA